MGCCISRFLPDLGSISDSEDTVNKAETINSDGRVDDIRNFYNLGEIVGAGSFGQVVHATLIKDPSVT